MILANRENAFTYYLTLIDGQIKMNIGINRYTEYEEHTLRKSFMYWHEKAIDIAEKCLSAKTLPDADIRTVLSIISRGNSVLSEKNDVESLRNACEHWHTKALELDEIYRSLITKTNTKISE
jgi:hypothetical protein